MKCTFGKTVQWQNDDGAFGVGQIVWAMGNTIKYECGTSKPGTVPDEHVLVAHSHTRELEFIEFGRLKPYPPDGKPIPQP